MGAVHEEKDQAHMSMTLLMNGLDHNAYLEVYSPINVQRISTCTSY